MITPLYKHGLASDCGNYRPVALTCSLYKVMERVIVLEMTDFLRKHNAISRQQHGFINRRSITTNLIETMNDWTLALKNNKKAQLSLTNPRDAKACQKCSNSTCLQRCR